MIIYLFFNYDCCYLDYFVYYQWVLVNVYTISRYDLWIDLSGELHFVSPPLNGHVYADDDIEECKLLFTTNFLYLQFIHGNKEKTTVSVRVRTDCLLNRGTCRNVYTAPSHEPSLCDVWVLLVIPGQRRGGFAHHLIVIFSFSSWIYLMYKNLVDNSNLPSINRNKPFNLSSQFLYLLQSYLSLR